MAKGLKYWFEFGTTETPKKVEIYEEGFVGSSTQLTGGSNPLVKSYNKDVGEKYLGGVVSMVVNIEAVSTSEFQAINLVSENYGDLLIRYLIDGVAQYNAIIVPFEGSDADLSAGIYNVSLGAECGLNQLKNLTYNHSNTRKSIIQVVKECLERLNYFDEFDIKVLDNTKGLIDADFVGVDYWDTYINDGNFEGLSCLEVINQIKQVYNEIVFSDGAWWIRNIDEISRGNSNVLTYDWATLDKTTTTYNRPTVSVQRRAGGTFGRLFSQQNIKITKPKSALSNVFPQGDMDNDTGWTYEGFAPLIFTFEDGLLKNNGVTIHSPTEVSVDGTYVESPAIPFYPFQEWFNVKEKERLKVVGKATKGNYIKHLRLQIVAIAPTESTVKYFLTTEGTWYAQMSGYPTPIYEKTYNASNEFVIDIPQPPYVTNDILISADKLHFGNFGYLGTDQLIPDTNIQYNLYIRVYRPERLFEDPSIATEPAYMSGLDVDIDYIHVQKVDISGVVENGFSRNYGLAETRDRKIDFTVSIGVGYPSYPSGLDCLFDAATGEDQIVSYKKHSQITGYPIDEHIAYSYLDNLSNQLGFYQGSIEGVLEFTDLIVIDDVKYRIHNLSHDAKFDVSQVKLVELKTFESVIQIDDIVLSDDILRNIEEQITKTLGSSTPLRYVDKNFTEFVLPNGERALGLRDDFKIKTVFSDEVFLRAASDGVITDVAEDTSSDFTLIKPAENGTYATREWVGENGWLLDGNPLTEPKSLGTTTNFDFSLIRNNTTIATVQSTGLNLGELLLTTGGVQFDTTPTQTGAVGKLMWNDTDGTLEFGMKGGNVVQQIGQELPVLVKHADNTGLTNGAVVYVVGSDGSNKTVRYALANAESTSSKTFGVMTEDASGGSKAFCTTFGIVRNIDTSALTEGAAVYLSPTVAGGMTTTKPSAPNHMVLVGFCIRSHATLGSIFVKIINGFELNEIHDVAIGTLANNNLLAYESATSLWKNKTYSELGLFPTPSGLTTNYIPKWNGTALANSQLFDSGTFVGIGTATPATLLDVRGQISASLGSASAPSFSFVGDLNTGVFSSGADTLALTTGGTSRMSITSAGDVIIGSAAGTNSFIVSKNITGGTTVSGIRSSGQIQSDVTSDAYLFRSVMNQANFALATLIGYESSIGTISGTGTNLINFRAASSSAGYNNVYGFQSVIASGTNRWGAYFSGTAQNYFRGNVGIGSGSTVPATELEVRGVISASLGSASLPSYTFVGDTNTGWWSPTADTQAWSLSGTEVMRLNATGLGIGVTPSYKLDVSGTGHFTGAVTFDTVPSSLQDASSANHLVRYSQWISSTTVKYLPTAVNTVALTNVSSLSGAQNINGVTGVAGTTRILLTAQTDATKNSIWVMQSGAWTRATDSDTDTEIRGFIVSVSGGTYAGYKYINTNGSAITIDTTNITYSEFTNISEIDPVFVSWRDTSRTANTFWAAPNGSNGAGTWRAIVASDIPTLNQNTTGSAATLTTSRNIAISGDLTWNVDFNGSAAVTAVGTLATVNSNIGTFAGITVNGKGLVTAATALTTLSSYGITDAQSTLVSGTNIKTVGTQSLLGSGDVTLASLNYWTKSGSDVSYIGGNVYAPYFEANGAIVALASTGTDNYTVLGVGSTSFQQKVYDVTNPRLETISSAGVLGTIFNGGNYRFGTGTDSGLAKVQVVGAIQQSSVTSSYIKANASGVLIAGTITTSDVSNLSSYTGFDSRYFTETESDARFVALAGSYANPTWITSLAWSKLTSVPSSFTPSAHTLDSHSNVTITSNSNGEILKWNGSAWINNTLAEAGIQSTLNGTGFVKSTSGVISYDTNTYLTGNQTISISGDATGSGATSIAITLANSGVTSGTYRSVTVNAKGLVTGATNPTTISGYGITDFYSQVVSGFVTGANSSVLNTDTLEVALEKLQGQINARISGNQTITLSGIVTGSGTTAITTAIADSALSIAKTSGLQTALDGKFATPSGLTTNYVSKWNGTGFSNSQIFDNGTSVGIAMASPSSTSKLHVNNAVGNSVRFQNTYFSNSLESNTSFARGGIFNNAEYIDEGGATKVWKIRNYGANDAAGILFSNSGTLNFISVPITGAFDKSLTHSELLSNARMTILSSGFVGINTTSPAYTLDVVGTIRTTSLMITSGAAVGSFLKANNVNGTSVWASITTSDISNLSSWTGSTSITTLGTIGTGTWNGTTISTAKGGTGLTTLGTANQLLRVNSGATALEYFTPTYISGNQTITLSGVVTGSGTTAITTSIANGAIANAMLANTAVANLSGTNTGDNSPNSLYSGLVSNATHTGDATGATSLTVVGIRGVSLPTLGVTAGFLRYTGTGTNTWVFDTSTYLTANQSISITGDATGTGTTSIALTLANVATAGTYRSVTINSKGLVTSGTNPTTISGYGITDFYSQVVSGFVTGANSTVLNTDTLEVALEKLQGQINARISGNQTITLSGVITGSGTTAITTSIADATLSIAKTSGLQTALDSKMATASYPDLVAIEALTGTSGFLKKTAANTWELDTNTYLTASLTSTYIGYGSSVNTLTGNSTFTYLDNRYIHLTSSGSNFNLGTFSSAGFIESVNGNLLLQARSTFGVVVDDGFFQVNDLSGSGTRMVVASSTGVLSTQTIPSGGGVPPLNSTQIGFGSGSNLMTSSANFVYDNGSLVLTNTTSANTNVIRINGSDGYDKNIFFSEVGGTNYGAYVGYRAGVNGSPDPTMLVMQTINNDSVMGGIAIHRQNGHVYIGLRPNSKAWNSDELNYNKLFVDGNMRVGGNEIIISGTSFKLSLSDAFTGAYTPSNGDKCTLTYDSSMAAFVLQKMNTYNDGTRTFLIL